MASAAVESFRSPSLRYERGRSGSASFAARPRGARHRSRSASRRFLKVALAPLATAPPALRCRTLRSARWQRSAARISESSAALQNRLRGGGAFKMLLIIREKQSALPLRGSGHTYRSS